MADRNQWEEEDRRERWKAISGVMEFASVVVGSVVILVLLAILISLVSWLTNDVQNTFATLLTRLR